MANYYGKNQAYNEIKDLIEQKKDVEYILLVLSRRIDSQREAHKPSKAIYW